MDIIKFRAYHSHLRKASYLHFTEEDTNVQGDELTSPPLPGIRAILLFQAPLSLEFCKKIGVECHVLPHYHLSLSCVSFYYDCGVALG